MKGQLTRLANLVTQADLHSLRSGFSGVQRAGFELHCHEALPEVTGGGKNHDSCLVVHSVGHSRNTVVDNCKLFTSCATWAWDDCLFSLFCPVPVEIS